jgi:hypothetical protein
LSAPQGRRKLSYNDFMVRETHPTELPAVTALAGDSE